MQRMIRVLAMVLVLCMMQLTAQAANPTPTPAPRDTTSQVMETVPDEIQALLDLAYKEYTTLNGKTLSKVNKYTEWRGKGVGFGWCGGFITWCTLQLGIPQDRLKNMKEEPKTGIQHVKEASVGKLLRGYQKMGRSTDIPQKGFLVVYAVRKTLNMTTHIGLVWDVEDLGNGKYRITTIEGNMSSRVKMYVHDYDRFAADRTRNMATIPESERTREESPIFNYRLQSEEWYINCFLMPWIPEEYMPATPTPMPTATPTPSPIPTPTPEPTPTPTPSPVPTPEEDYSLADLFR